MKKLAQLLSPFFIVLIFVLNGCSTSAVPVETAQPAPSSTPAAPPSPYDVAPVQTFIVTGILAAVTARTITIDCPDGTRCRFVCAFDRIRDKLDALVPGSLVRVEYYDRLDGGENAGLAVATVVTVEASPDEVLVMRAGELLETMTLSEKVGQLFLAHYPASAASELTRALQPGGYILFSGDLKDKTPEDVLADVQDCQRSAEITMLIGVDEEGGMVTRVSKYPQFRSVPFSSPQSLYLGGGWDAVVSDTLEKDTLLKSLGINLNFAPVCDVSTDPSDFIYKRAFGENAELTAKYVKTVVETMVSNKLGCVLKHFPGYGSNVDTHTGSSYDGRPYEAFVTSDLRPFEAGIAAGAGAVMVSHNIVACMDDSAPVSMSAAAHRVLREALGFDGVVITDDINMRAALDYAGDENAAVLAVLAGNDMIISPYIDEQIPAVLTAVREGLVTEARIDASVLRILIWKLRLGIL